MVAGIDPRLVGQRLDVLLLHADVLERRRHTAVFDEVVDELNGLPVGLGVAARDAEVNGKVAKERRKLAVEKEASGHPEVLEKIKNARRG